MRSLPPVATQADMEAGTNAARPVTPGRQQFHPSASKAWASWNSAATIQSSYNVASITDNGAGTWTMNIGTDMSGAEFPGAANVGHVSTVDYLGVCQFTGNAAGTFHVGSVRLNGGAQTDPNAPDRIYCFVLGDQ